MPDKDDVTSSEERDPKKDYWTKERMDDAEPIPFPEPDKDC